MAKNNYTTYSQILWQGYKKFLLPLGGKTVPTPYRINEIGGSAQRGFQGKSTHGTLTRLTKKVAEQQKFDLKKAKIEAIRKFMSKNKLGIDCSGFIYHILNYLLKNAHLKTLKQNGFPKVTRTNVQVFTSPQFSKAVYKIPEIQPSDLIRTNSGRPIPHLLIVIEKKDNQIIYVHSGKKNDGVQLGKVTVIDPDKPIEQQKWEEEYLKTDWREDLGDGVKRLKVLSRV